MLEIGIFRLLDLERTLIYQKKNLWKSAIFHSIKLPFDAEVAKKLLKCYLLPRYYLKYLIHELGLGTLKMVSHDYWREFPDMQSSK